MVTLFCIVKMGTFVNRIKVFTGLLFEVTLLVMLAPEGLYLLPPPWNMRYIDFQIIVWLVVLIFLLHQAYREKRGYD